jgi:hypothetical protein
VKLCFEDWAFAVLSSLPRSKPNGQASTLSNQTVNQDASSNDPLFKPKHIYSWKTLIHAAKDAEAIKDCIRRNEHVAIRAQIFKEMADTARGLENDLQTCCERRKLRKTSTVVAGCKPNGKS